ncbi:unnamed protein product [Schistocephalus solidus]|uniref:SEC7 domain-containing protein n=1 Tax=Schistocephalus solidus TaxID=70667 RepID=A0A183TE51_SCHSO|nr:unnamed protein product [Schistocephalus solidus]
MPISKDFNMQVLDEFLKLHDFDGLEFLPALRQFLLSFQLPGESQKIDRILASFGQQYVLQNPTVFRTSRPSVIATWIYAVFLLLLLPPSIAYLYIVAREHKSDRILKVFHGIKSKPLQVVEEAPELSILSGWLWKLGQLKGSSTQLFMEYLFFRLRYAVTGHCNAPPLSKIVTGGEFYGIVSRVQSAEKPSKA